ncbi:RidA family protein [Arenicellales bacterium nBUS_48]|jgi:2-iminobutanoate/2-iminopropanoate deaminase|nr:RidA family protein [Pseudomonadota bacterium]|tara:strand:+ start:518 stop:916 length:399 start_codon:yes stop_codon:yes gene_type:complete
MPRKTLKPSSLEFQPRPSYPYSPGATGGGFIFTAGQVAWDESGEVTAIGDVAAQTRQTLKNVVSVLHEGGATVDDVLKCNVYLTDMRDFDAMNAEFAIVFPNDPPARTTVEARLADAAMLVEIEAIAWVESK